MTFAYSQILSNPQWELKRQEILRIDNYKCRLCKSDNNLQIHHLVYIQGLKPWQYPDEMLITLCEKCHKEEERYKRLIGTLIPELTAKGISCKTIYKHIESLKK